MSPKQFDGKLLKNIVNIAVPTALCTAAAIYMASLASYDVAVLASIDGTPCGYVESCDDLVEAKTNLDTTLYSATEGNYITDIEIGYDLVHVRDAVYLTKEECAQLMWKKVEDDFSEAYMLYVDDKQAAAYENKSELDALIESIESELQSLADESFSAVKIASRVRIEKQLCLNSMFKSIDEINDLLNPLAQSELENAKLAREASETVSININSVKAASPESEISDVVAEADSSDLTLDYNFVNTVTLTEVIYYETQYINDYDSFIGTDTVVSRGSNGKRTVTYEIIYDTEGDIIGRNEIAQTVIIPSTDRVVKIGAKPIPEAVPTGEFIWPCDTPYGVSSPYGWRVIYGRKEFHLGIDIPNVTGSPIYAADGGKVVYAGYSPSYGYNIKIEHADGYSTLYAHLSGVLVSVGDKIYQGQLIGKMGNTGVSYGSHLHFEVRINDQNYDPELFLPALEGAN